MPPAFRRACWAAFTVLLAALLIGIVVSIIWLIFDQRRVERLCNQKCGGEAFVYESVPGLDVPGHCTCWIGHDHLLKYEEIAPSIDLF